jgi:hypothetical protein
VDEVALDLMIRGTGSNRTPDEHLGALPSDYQGWRVFLYGQPLVASAYPATTDLTELAGWLEAAGDANLLLYGDDGLFRVIEPDAVGTIWVTMGVDRDGVREVWRLRQQYAWLAKKRLGLLVEPTEGSDRPDVERLMRLTRAVQVLTFQAGPPLSGPVWASTPDPVTAPTAAESNPVWTTSATAEATPAWTAPATGDAAPAANDLTAAELASLTAPTPAAELAPANESTVPAGAEETASGRPVPAAEPVQAYEAALYVPAHTPTDERGADLTMTTPQAEQALLQRYALVRERRTTTARLQEVEAVIKNLLKDIFVSRFESGIDAAAEFEAQAKKLAEVSAEFAQLTRSMARIEEELAKLAWLKDELEI